MERKYAAGVSRARGGGPGWSRRLELVALGQHRHHQVPQWPGEVILGHHDGPLTHTDLVDGVARGYPVGREARGLADKVLPAPGVGAAAGVEHPAADVPILRYSGDLKPHPPSLSPLGWQRQRRSLHCLTDGQYGRHQVGQRPGQVMLGDKHGPLIDTEMVDGPSRGRAVGRHDSQRAGDEILPLASVTAPGGVNHPAPHGPVPFDSGHYDPHGPSLSPSAARLGNGMICHTYRRHAGGRGRAWEGGRTARANGPVRSQR